MQLPPPTLAFFDPFTLILFAVFLVLSEILKPKPKNENARPSPLGDFKFPTATEGRPVPLIWGTVKMTSPNVVWYGNLVSKPIKKKMKTGMFSSKKITVGYRYYVGVQMALCRGGVSPAQELTKIWIGDTEVFSGSITTDGATLLIDKPKLLGGDDQGQGGTVGTVRFHSGSYTQGVSSYLATHQQIGGDTPAYRGCCYVVFEDGYIGNSTQIKPWSFELRRIPNGLGLSSSGTVNSGKDANPMNVIYEIITNSEWGLGQPSTDIDTADFTTAANTLRDEGNGFSFLLDGQMPAEDLLKEIERQIDGVIYVDRNTGKYKCNLARGGYVLSSKFALTDSNVIEVSNFSRGAWDDTMNNVLLKFSNRANEYRETYAGAQDMANMRLQGGRVVTIEQTYPGVKNEALANVIAWGNLRTVSYPVVRATLVCNRTAYNLNMGDVVRWTDADLEITDMAMRVTKVDLGELANGRITLSLVEDIFVHDTGVFVPPGATEWEAPEQDVIAIPTGDSLVFEAPLGLISRDVSAPSTPDRIFIGARKQADAASTIDVVSRTGSDPYTAAGDVAGFSAAGRLTTGITASGTQGGITITVDANPDSVASMEDELFEDITADDAGVQLGNIVLIGNEFFLFRSFAESGGDLVFSDGYRGVLDSAPATHATNDRVWVLTGNLTDRNFVPGSTVDVKLLPASAVDVLPVGSATTISVVMNNRVRRPYPPVALRINSSAYPNSSNVDNASTGGPGSGLDDAGFAINYVRRDFRTTNEVNSVVSEASLPSDFPAANTTEYAVEVRNDPAGTNTLLFTTSYSSAATIELSRTQILRNTAGIIPSTLRVSVKTRHTYEGVVYDALQNTVWDFTVTAAVFSGTFNFGVLAQNVESAQYTAVDTGTFTLNSGTALGSGNIQVSINGGAYSTVISSGTTTGTFSATAGDIIEVRHTQAGATSSQTFCELTFSTTRRAYAVFTY